MEQTKKPMDSMQIARYMKTMRSTGRYESKVCDLVEDDLNYGLCEDEINLYLKNNFKLAQMEVLSGSLRRGLDEEFINLLIKYNSLTGYQMQVALDFFEKGVPIDSIAEIMEQNVNPTAMRDSYQVVLSKVEELKKSQDEMPEYAKHLVAQVEDVVKTIGFQDERFNQLNEKLTIFQNTQKDEEVRDGLIKKLADTETEMSSQQDKLMQANSAVARLRDQIRDKDKEMSRMQTRIDTLEDKLLKKAERQSRMEQNVIPDMPVVSNNVDNEKSETIIANNQNQGIGNATMAANANMVVNDPFAGGQIGIPVYYQMPVIDSAGRIVQRVQVERTARKSDSGFGAILGKLGFKKKSRQDIVKLVASGDLVPEQLIQIKSGIEKGLTEGQLVELINNNVSAEKMKEIIEIAVLENGMDY